MNKNLQIIGVVVLLVVIGITGWFLVNKQSQDNTGLTQKDEGLTQKSVGVKDENQQEAKEIVKSEEKNNEQKIENSQEKNGDEKTAEKKIKELIDSLPETSLKELGYKKMNMSNWKTYRNEELGIEVKYPQNWTFGEGHKALRPVGQSKEIIDITFNAPGDTPGGGTWRIIPREKSLMSFEKILQSLKNIGGILKKIKIDGYSAVHSSHINKQQSPDGENGIFESFVIVTDNKIFLVINDRYSKRDYVNVQFIK